MRRNFVQVAEFLQDNFPELRGKIEGANYPVPPAIEFLSNMVSVAQMIGLAWMVMGAEGIFRLVGMQVPSWAKSIEQNSIQFGILLFLIMPQFVQRYTTTGAFELYLDDATVFSKMSEGRFPTGDELLGLFKEAGLQMKTA
mmetsp:Transcript_10683/g.21944  ORF Transcript_10683/g.21944 Transcript_10683/m.21944 type:complete len:141 (-) Transcript_10683:1731-2153(-)